MIIRPVLRLDQTAISSVVTQAFGRAAEAGMIEAVRAGGQALCEYAAEEAGAIVGHILFSRMTCRPDRLIAGLAPLAVAPPFQGRGVGSALVLRGLDACRSLGARGCVVLGAPAYYGRFGFSRAPETVDCRYSSLEAFQALAFDAGAFAESVVIAYPPAFN